MSLRLSERGLDPVLVKSVCESHGSNPIKANSAEVLCLNFSFYDFLSGCNKIFFAKLFIVVEGHSAKTTIGVSEQSKIT